MITKNIADNYEPDFERGEIILIDKPLRLSSFSIVYKVRKAVAVKKVGHAGTLDPMASGLMIVCTGRATKEISSMLGLNKTYNGIISLGKTSPSFDSETEFDSEKSIDNITEEKILETAGKFLGGSLQIPPMYSAVKYNGKALYKFARKGVEVERKPREIFISKFDILKIDLPDVHFKIGCSSGTYIRVIADDLGKKLGCGAYLKNLRRATIGEFDVDDAFDIKEFIAYSTKFVPVS